MCTPGMATGLSVGGSLFKDFASYGANNRRADLADVNARLLGTQADIARGNADLAVTRGNYDQFLVGRKVNQTLGLERSMFAGGNVDPTYGSPNAMIGYTAAQGETDMMLTRARMMSDRANALTTGANIDMRAAGEAGNAAAFRSAATTSLFSAPFDAGTSFLMSQRKWPGLSAGGYGVGGGRMMAGGNPFGE